MVFSFIWSVLKIFSFSPSSIFVWRGSTMCWSEGMGALMPGEPGLESRSCPVGDFTVLRHSFLFKPGVITPPPRTVGRF